MLITPSFQNLLVLLVGQAGAVTMGQRRARIRCMKVLLLEEGVEGGKFLAAQLTQLKSGEDRNQGGTKQK